MKNKKSHGWVRWCSTAKAKGFIDGGGSSNNCLRDALVYATRKQARTSIMPYRLSIDTIRMVSLTKKGKAKKVIGRG